MGPVQNRLQSIQVLRGFAAIGVVLAHLSCYFAVLGMKSAIPDFFIGNVGVDLFFVISGFIMVYASEPIFGAPGAARIFLVKRLVRIVPLYWLTTAFQCYLFYRFGGAEIYEPLWRNLLASLFFLPIPRTDGSVVPILLVGWTLNYEMLFYVIFAVSLTAMKRRLTVVLFVSVTLGAAVLLGLAAGDQLPVCIRHLTSPFILEFLLGAWIAILFRSGLAIKPEMAWLLIAAGLCLVYFSPPKGGLFRTATWGFGFALIVAAAALRRYDLSKNNIFVRLGEASYSIYLTHWFVLMTPPAIILSLVNPTQHPRIYAVTIFATTVAVGFLVYTLLERRLTSILRSQAILSTAPRWRASHSLPMSRAQPLLRR